MTGRYWTHMNWSIILHYNANQIPFYDVTFYMVNTPLALAAVAAAVLRTCGPCGLEVVARLAFHVS